MPKNILLRKKVQSCCSATIAHYKYSNQFCNSSIHFALGNFYHLKWDAIAKYSPLCHPPEGKLKFVFSGIFSTLHNILCPYDALYLTKLQSAVYSIQPTQVGFVTIALGFQPAGVVSGKPENFVYPN